jgi:hypothetical protein
MASTALGSWRTVRLHLGCIAAHGNTYLRQDRHYTMSGGMPATAFLLELAARLQEAATVIASSGEAAPIRREMGDVFQRVDHAVRPRGDFLRCPLWVLAV